MNDKNQLVRPRIRTTAPSGPVRAIEKLPARRIPTLDGLRGIGILVVITKHYGDDRLAGTTRSSMGDYIAHVFRELHAPDLFLVLTGFLLGARLLAALGAPRYYSSFYLRRVCRTFPLYYLLLLCFTTGLLARDALAPWFWLDLEWPFGTPWSMAAYVVFLQSFWIAAEGSLGSQWLSVTWTLALQEQFYALLPPALHWTPRWALGYVLLGLFVVAPIGRLIVVQAVPPDEWYRYAFLLCCRSEPLIIGVLAAWLLQTDAARNCLMRLRWLLNLVASLLFLGFVVLAPAAYTCKLGAMFVLGDAYRALMYLALVLIAAHASDGVVGTVLRTPFLVELGRISYGLFLFHQLVRDLFFRAVLDMPPVLDGWETWLATVEAFVLTVLVAELCWRYVERPLIAWSKSD